MPIDGDDRLRVGAPRLLLAASCVLAISLVPLYAHRLVTMLDLFNHLARGFVLANYHRNPLFQTFWLPNWRVMPSLAIDGMVLALNGVMPLLAIGKLFVVLVFIVLLSGLLNLHQAAHRKWSLVPLLGALFLYNRMMLSGLVNYMLGIGLCLHGLAIWIRLRERPVGLRLGVFAGIVLLTYLVHLMAAAVLGLMVAGVEIAGLLRRRAGLMDWVRDLAGPVLAYAPVFAIMIFLAPHSARNGVIIYHDLTSKLGAFAVVITYDLPAEVAGLAMLAVALAWLALRGAVRLNPSLLGAVLLLAAAQMAMPYQILTGTAADHRVPIALWLLGCCMIDVAIAGRSAAWLFLAAVLLVGLSRLGIIERQWTLDAPVYAEVEAALAALPAGTKVASANPPDAFDSDSDPAALAFILPDWMIVPRGGFTQTLWTIPNQHPLIMRPALRRLADATGPETLWALFAGAGDGAAHTARERAALAALPGYDFVAFIDRRPFTVVPSDRLAAVDLRSHIKIFRVRSPGSTPP